MSNHLLKPGNIAAMVLTQARFQPIYPSTIMDTSVSSTANSNIGSISITQQAIVPIGALLGTELSDELCSQIIAILNKAMQKVFSNSAPSTDGTAIATIIDNNKVVINYYGRSSFPTQQLLRFISILDKEFFIKSIPWDVFDSNINNIEDPVIKNTIDDYYMQQLLQKVGKINPKDEW